MVYDTTLVGSRLCVHGNVFERFLYWRFQFKRLGALFTLLVFLETFSDMAIFFSLCFHIQTQRCIIACDFLVHAITKRPNNQFQNVSDTENESFASFPLYSKRFLLHAHIWACNFHIALNFVSRCTGGRW